MRYLLFHYNPRAIPVCGAALESFLHVIELDDLPDFGVFEGMISAATAAAANGQAYRQPQAAAATEGAKAYSAVNTDGWTTATACAAGNLGIRGQAVDEDAYRYAFRGIRGR